MRVVTENGVPIIEGTAKEIVQLATAALGAARVGEAALRKSGRPVIGIRTVKAEGEADDRG